MNALCLVTRGYVCDGVALSVVVDVHPTTEAKDLAPRILPHASQIPAELPQAVRPDTPVIKAPGTGNDLEPVKAQVVTVKAMPKIKPSIKPRRRK
jgi:hypothetical protein